MKDKVVRNSNIELLRLILIIMVITLHFNYTQMGGALDYAEGKSQIKYFLYFLESLSICSVNCFMIISGYFLAYNKRVKFNKILDLFLIVVFYRVSDYLISVGLSLETFSISHLIEKIIPVNYFAIFYCITYLFSPFIVKIFDHTNKKEQKFFVLLLFFVFIIYPTIIDTVNNIVNNNKLNVISSITIQGSISGYTVVQFFLCLIVGMYLKRNRPNVSNFFLLIIFITAVLIMTFTAERIPSMYNYSSMFTFITAICLFLFFNRINLTSKIINYLSRSVFAIFCIHTSTTAIYFWRNYFIRRVYFEKGIDVILTYLVSVTVMFLTCLIIDILIRNSVGRIKSVILKKLTLEFNIDE